MGQVHLCGSALGTQTVPVPVICPGVGWLGWGQDAAAASPQRALLPGRLCLSPHKRAALD